MATSSSALNPHAPIFVPSCYRSVEDFSDEWWNLVQSSPSFRDYWLRECFSDPQIDLDDIPTDFIFPDDDEHDSIHQKSVTKEKNGGGGGLDLMALGWMKWMKPRGGAAMNMMPRYCDKAPKIVNVRVSPRPIQQPR